jgi:predicted neuraminidase
MQKEKNMEPKIKIKETIVFDGNVGWKHEGVHYKLACAPVITETPSGELLCTWLSGADTEPASDNCILISRSKDCGKSWSEPEIFVASDKDGFGGVMLQRSGDKLVKLAAKLPLDKQYNEWNYSRSESYDGGHTFGEATPITLMSDEGVSASLCYRIVTSDNRVLIAGQTYTKRKTPLTASAEQMVWAKTEEEAAAMTLGEGMKPIPFGFAHYRSGCVVFETDPDIREFKMLGRVDNRPLYLGEPTIIELKSGRLVMLIRAEWGGYLWRSDSDDGGRTWCDAYPTDIKNPSTLANLLRLPDGRIALFHNDNGGQIGKWSKRDPLSIWVSDDEMETWSIKENVGTGGAFSYPAPLVLDNGKVVFSYDLNRRQAVFVEVEFS